MKFTLKINFLITDLNFLKKNEIYLHNTWLYLVLLLIFWLPRASHHHHPYITDCHAKKIWFAKTEGGFFVPASGENYFPTATIFLGTEFNEKPWAHPLSLIVSFRLDLPISCQNFRQFGQYFDPFSFSWYIVLEKLQVIPNYYMNMSSSFI